MTVSPTSQRLHLPVALFFERFGPSHPNGLAQERLVRRSEALQARVSLSADRFDSVVFGATRSEDPKKVFDVPEMTGRLAVSYLRSTQAQPTAAPPLYTTSVKQLADNLASYVRGAGSSFQYLHPADIDQFATQVGREPNVRAGLRWLRDQQWASVTYPPNKSAHIQMTDAGHQQVTLPIETILMNNLPDYLAVSRVVQQQIISGTLPVGSVIPETVTLPGGHQVANGVRVDGLNHLSETTGLVTLVQGGGGSYVNQPAAGNPLPRREYQVVNPQLVAPTVVTVRRPESAILAIFDTIDRQGVGLNQVIPSNEALMTTHGLMNTTFRKAKQRLQSEGFLASQGKPQNLQYTLLKQPSAAEYHRWASESWDRAQLLGHAFLRQLTNQDRQSRWSPTIQLIPRVPFPDDMPDPSRRSLLSEMGQALAVAPVLPLIQNRTEGRVTTYLNPVLDFDQLSSGLAQLETEPQVTRAAGLYGVPLFALPRLYEPQVQVKPVLQVHASPTASGTHGFDLRLGLANTDSVGTCPGSFRSLDQMANNTGHFNLARYGEQSRQLVMRLYPLPALEQLKTQSHVPVSEEDLTAFRRLQPTLEAWGFEVQLPTITTLASHETTS